MNKWISWVEIPATDFERAVNFYSKVWMAPLKAADFGAEKMACLPSGEGAVICAPDYNPAAAGLMVSLMVSDSIERTLERIVAYGGSIVKDKTKITAEGKGSFAVFLDSEGNRLGLYEN